MGKIWTLGKEWCSFPERRRERKGFILACIGLCAANAIFGAGMAPANLIVLLYLFHGIRHNIWQPEGLVTQLALPREKRIYYSMFGGMLKAIQCYVVIQVIVAGLYYILMNIVLGNLFSPIPMNNSIMFSAEFWGYLALETLLGAELFVLAYIVYYPICVFVEQKRAVIWAAGGTIAMMLTSRLLYAKTVTKTITATVNAWYLEGGTTTVEEEIEMIAGAGTWAIGLAVLTVLAAIAVYRFSVKQYEAVGRKA